MFIEARKNIFCLNHSVHVCQGGEGDFCWSCFASVALPVSSRQCVADNHAGDDLSPQSTCSSPGLSRLTYISMNESTGLPKPEQQKVARG